MQKQNNENENEQQEILSNNVSMLNYKIGELRMHTMKFKSDTLEIDFQQFLVPKVKIMLRVIIFILVIHQILTVINMSDSFNQIERIIYVTFCGVSLIIVQFLNSRYLQKMNWIINVFTIIVFADCIQDSSDKGELRILYNGMGIILCFWVQSQSFLLDCSSIFVCFVLIHIFKGIDLETGLLTIITITAILFLKHQSYISERKQYLSLKLADLWQDIAKEVSFVQIIVFTFDSEKEKFTYQGSKQSSDQFLSINNDASLNLLLENMTLDEIIKAPEHQIKDLQRSVGLPLKPILIRSMNEKVWSFLTKQEKTYVAISINLRGINSEDKVFILTLGLNDPEALRQTNEQQQLQSSLLQVSLNNNNQRFMEMQDILQETTDLIKKNNIMSRTIESISFQQQVIKKYVENEKQNIQENNLEQQKNDENKKIQNISSPKSQLTNHNLIKTDRQEYSQIIKMNELKQSISKQENNKENINNPNQQEVYNSTNKLNMDHNKQKVSKQSTEHSQSSISSDDYAENEEFFLKNELDNIKNLYDNQINVNYSLDEKYVMNTNKKKIRQLLISLFENCYQLQKQENISSSLLFSIDKEDSNTNIFFIEIQVNEKSKYFYEDKNDPHYCDGATWYQALCKPFRYLNGHNHSLINSLEFQNLAIYLEKMSNKQMQQRQNNNDNIIFSTLWLFNDPQKVLIQIENKQMQQDGKSQIVESNLQQNKNQMGQSIDYKDIKFENCIKAYSYAFNDSNNRESPRSNKNLQKMGESSIKNLSNNQNKAGNGTEHQKQGSDNQNIRNKAQSQFKLLNKKRSQFSSQIEDQNQDENDDEESINDLEKGILSEHEEPRIFIPVENYQIQTFDNKVQTITNKKNNY